MSHEERPNFLNILEDLRNASGGTCTNNKTNFEGKTQEEIIDDIRRGIHELHKRGILIDEMSFYDHQLKVIKSLEDWHSGKIKPVPDVFLFDSIPNIYSAKTDKEKSVFAFRNLFPTIEPEFKNTINRFHSQYTIEELQKILLKHPNRMDLKMELIKLQRENKTKYIGRPKRKKRK